LRLGHLFASASRHKRRIFYYGLAGLVTAGAGVAAFLTNLDQVPSAPAASVAPKVVKRKVKAASQTELLAKGWNYMPGTARENGGLWVGARNFTFVEQDGTDGQADPPLNLFGTHLEVKGGFALTARFSSSARAKASLHLYGAVPITLDEFRIEPKSIRVTLESKTLTVRRWDGRSKDAAFKQHYGFTPASTNVVQVERTSGKINVSVNGTRLASVPENNTFSRDNVWFGPLSERGRWLLSSLKAEALTGGQITVADNSSLEVTNPDAEGLQNLAKAKRPDFLIGAAAALGPMVSDSAYAQVLFGGNFGAITTENALKWKGVHPQAGVYDFHEGDALVALAERHGLKIHGHTLVFGEANPRWVRVLPPEQLEQIMLDHIKTVAGHYKGKMFSWDVVNEPFDDDEWDQLRPNLWQRAMGEGYIAKALHAARAADPDALLFINDYGLEEDSERWDAMLGLVTKLKNDGVPIDGVGFEAHVYERGDKIDITSLRNHIRDLAAAGLKARISEMDVYIEDGTETQAEQYSQVFKVCLDEPNCVSFTTWGVSDRYDWFIDDDGSVQQGEDYLWDKEMQPTPAHAAIKALLR
jgi:endo-1,4-beta-xylanase